MNKTERNNLIFEEVDKFLKQYKETGQMRFDTSTGAMNKGVKIVLMVFVLIWLCVVYYFVKQFMGINYTWVLTVVFCVLFIFFIVIILNGKSFVEFIALSNGVLNIVATKNNKKTQYNCPLKKAIIKSRLSKNSDEFRGIFYITFVFEKQKTIRINVAQKYHEFIAFLIAVKLLKDNISLNDVSTEEFSSFVNQVLYSK